MRAALLLAAMPAAYAAGGAPAIGPAWSDIGQTLIALVFIVFLIVGCAVLMRRFSLLPVANGGRLRVVSGVMVGARERVVVVEIEGEWLVLGVTSENVRLLHKLDRPEDAPAAPEAPAFAKALAKMMQRKESA
ncbi:flagellar biosynthetic protein FliO [Chitinibacteraceae bacterium HSL-7]